MVWSVRDIKSGLVVDRSSSVILSNVQLKVSQAGRAKVIREKRKCVHAGVVGNRINEVPEGNWIRVEYNPYKYDSFVYSDSPSIGVTNAKWAKLTGTGLFILI